MAVPCLPAYGGYDNHWLKAVRRQQNAFAALSIPAPPVSAARLLPAGSGDELQTARAVAGTASACSASTRDSLVAQALSIGRQHGLPTFQNKHTPMPSMPRSKAEKQVNKQALATISAQLDPVNIKLDPSTPKQHQESSRNQSGSPTIHSITFVDENKLAAPVSLHDVTKQQLLSFCRTVHHSPSSSRQQSASGEAADLIGKSIQAPETPHVHCYGSQRYLLLEEPVFADDAAGFLGPLQTAAAEPVKSPNAPHLTTSKGNHMLLPDGGLNSLWLEVPEECPAPGACDALYTKVTSLPVDALHNTKSSNTTAGSPTCCGAVSAVQCPSMDSILNNWFKQSVQQQHKQRALGQHPTDQTAAAVPSAQDNSVSLQHGSVCHAESTTTNPASDSTQAEPASAAAEQPAVPVAPGDDHADLHIHDSSKWGPIIGFSQDEEGILLEEQLLPSSPALDLQQRSTATHKAQHLLSVQDVIHLAKTTAPAAGPAAPNAGDAEAAQGGAAAAVPESRAERKLWEEYVAVDMGMPAAVTAFSGPTMQLVQQQMLHLPAMVAAAVLPTASLLQQQSSQGIAADPSQQHQQQCSERQAPVSSTDENAPADVGKVLVATVLQAAASSPRRRRVSSRQAETPVCLAPNIVAWNTAVTPAVVPADKAVSTGANQHQQQTPAKGSTAPVSTVLQLPEQLYGLTGAAASGTATDTPAMTAAATGSPAVPTKSAPAALTAEATAAEAAETAAQMSDGSQLSHLSPSDMLIEVPVCISENKGPQMAELLLGEALALTKRVLARAGEAAATGDAAPEGCNDQHMGWDASWGDLRTAAAVAADPASTNSPWWASRPVQNMLLGQHPATLDSNLAGQLPSNLDPAEVAGFRPGNLGSNLGSVLLEGMLAGDMQQDSCGLLLPVTLFPDDTRLMGPGSSSSSDPDFIQQMISGCGCKKQSTAALELYIDWSWLQPLPAGTAAVLHAAAGAQAATGAAVGGKRLREGDEDPTAAAAGKRIRRSSAPALAAGPAAAVGGATLAFDLHAWISLVGKQHGLGHLQMIQELNQVKGPAAVLPIVSKHSQQASTTWCLHALQDCMLQTMQQQAAAVSAEADWAADETAAAAIPEVVPQEVEAAVAAWMSALAAVQSATVQQTAAVVPETPAHTTVADGANASGSSAMASATATAAASEMDFFMQLQNLAAAGKAGSKRRLSTAQQQQQAAKVAAEAPLQAAAAARDSAAADVGGRKRVRLDALQDEGATIAGAVAGADCMQADPNANMPAAPLVQQQHSVADQTVTGVPGQPGGGPDAAQQLVVVQPPTIIHVELPLPLLQIMLSLQANRKIILASMEEPDPQLLSCRLWDDRAVQKAIANFQQTALRQQKSAAAAEVQQQKQHARKLGALLILAQAASCLLHYGVRVAHLFLQHSLQKLPSVAAACEKAAAGLAKAYKAVEKLPAAAAGSTAAGNSISSSSSGVLSVQEDHPKLSKLQDLLTYLNRTKPGCKMLLVAETKAFFSLYQAISAAGLSAVQLDRSRKLLQLEAPAGAEVGGSGTDATTVDKDAWHAAAQAALASGCCVLVTHEHLMHPSMPIAMFDILVEYVVQEDVSAKADSTSKPSSSSSSTRRDDVAVRFSECHHVFKMVPLDLRKAAADIAAAAAGRAAAVSAADSVNRPATAAAAAAAVVPQQQPSEAEAITRPVPAAAVPGAAGKMTTSQEQQTAAACAEAAAAAELRRAECPLVLNRSTGSLLRQRKVLYESLLQLEGQGYVLVERNLAATAISCGSKAPASGINLAAAVDVVLSPAACLCVWGEGNLPKIHAMQEPAAVMSQLAKSLLQLSMSYDTVYYILELPEQLLQTVMKQLAGLQQVAAAAGTRLQTLCSFSAANTQDYILTLCRSVSASFWSSNSSSNSGSTQLKPPTISDIPTPQEALLNSCCALNPLSAAVLASKGVCLRTMFDVLAAGQANQADEQTKQMLIQLSVGIPEHSMQLLAAQVTALHLKLEGDSPQLPKSSAKRKRGQQEQQQQLEWQQHQQQQELDWQRQEWHQQQQQQMVHEEQIRTTQQPHMQHQQPAADGIPAEQQQQMEGLEAEVPYLQDHHNAHYAAAAHGGEPVQMTYSDQVEQGMYKQHQSHRQQQMANGDQQQCMEAARMYGYPFQDSGMTDFEQVDSVYADAQYPAHPQQQQQHVDQDHLQLGIDPAGVLDAFLYSRKQQHLEGAAAAAAVRAGPGRQQHLRQQLHRLAQQQLSVPRREHGSRTRRHPGQQHQQQQQQIQHQPQGYMGDELPDMAVPFASDLEMSVGVGGGYLQQQQQAAWQQGDYMPQQQLDGSYQHDMFAVQDVLYDEPGIGIGLAGAAGPYDQGLHAEDNPAYDHMGGYESRNMQFEGVRRSTLGSNNKGGSSMFGTAAAAAAGAAAAGAGTGRDLFGIGNKPPTTTAAARRSGPIGGMFGGSCTTSVDWASGNGSTTAAALTAARRGASNPLFGGGAGVERSSLGQQQASRAGRYAPAAVGLGCAHSDPAENLDLGDDVAEGDLPWDTGVDAGLGGGKGGLVGGRGIATHLGCDGSSANPRRLTGHGHAGTGGKGAARPTASATTSRSSLLVEAFMPHRNPTRQLKYKKGVGGIVQGKGKQQSKLFWG